MASLCDILHAPPHYFHAPYTPTPTGVPDTHACPLHCPWLFNSIFKTQLARMGLTGLGTSCVAIALCLMPTEAEKQTGIFSQYLH
jgi:hypothetical protein